MREQGQALQAQVEVSPTFISVVNVLRTNTFHDTNSILVYVLLRWKSSALCSRYSDPVPLPQETSWSWCLGLDSIPFADQQRCLELGFEDNNLLNSSLCHYIPKVSRTTLTN
jgi:hypothetical protein